MNLKLLRKKLAVSTMVGILLAMGSSHTSHATEIVQEWERGPTVTIAESYTYIDMEAIQKEELEMTAEENLNRGYADVEDYVYIQMKPEEDSEWIGKLYEGNVVTILEIDQEWTQIISGNVKGYVETEHLAIGLDGAQQFEESTSSTITVDVNTLNVRLGPSTDYERVAQVHRDDVLEYIDETENGWYLIKLGEEQRYICGKYASKSSKLTVAESKQEEEDRIAAEEEAKRKAEEAKRKAEEAAQRAKDIANGIIPAGSGAGDAVVEYAMQFIGNPYVWGGTSLTNGADCSGFVQSVYKHFGVSLPRTSGAQRSVGVSVPYSEAQLGDIVCYSGHVGIYMGDGKIVNAINSKKGIGILSATYTKILSVRRVI